MRVRLKKTALPMAEPKTNELMEKIVSLCKRKGFVFQSSEIYGGINGFWDYGPLGAELKRNVKELWWNTMTRFRDDVVGLEATIIMHPKIWRASRPCGDVRRPDARMSDDQKTRSRRSGGTAIGRCLSLHRRGIRRPAWKSNEAFCRVARPRANIRKAPAKWRANFMRKAPPMPPANGRLELNGETTEAVENSIDLHPESGVELTEARPFNLMFKTYVGPVESEENVAYLRPETAQAIFAQFKNVLETSRQKVPFGIAQIGKAFRNEVTPRNFTFRSREFEQMELEFFIKPDEAVEAISGSVVEGPGTGHPGEPQPNWGWQDVA